MGYIRIIINQLFSKTVKIYVPFSGLLSLGRHGDRDQKANFFISLFRWPPYLQNGKNVKKKQIYAF